MKVTIKFTKDKYEGIVRYNGNHYFADDKVRGGLYWDSEEDKTYINHEWIDLFGNEMYDMVEIKRGSQRKVNGR